MTDLLPTLLGTLGALVFGAGALLALRPRPEPIPVRSDPDKRRQED